jgi:uncharacterized protein GlcG (DUF336 family)
MNISPHVTEKQALTLQAAKKIAAAAAAKAAENRWRVVIAIVDDGGHLLYLERMDETQTGSIDAAVEKARSAAAYKRPTKFWEDAIAQGRNALLGLPHALPIEGGIPLTSKGAVIGAIGVSGCKAVEDGMIAKAGADSLDALLAG